MVATSLVDKLLNVPSSTQESLPELTRFLCEFSESVSLLNALNIPDLGSFLLFALAFRRLPISSCKLFESTVTSDYPSMSQLLTFVESRVSILELVGDSTSRSNKGTTASRPFYGNQLWSERGEIGIKGNRRLMLRRSLPPRRIKFVRVAQNLIRFVSPI
jgi:hypothetical protein